MSYFADKSAVKGTEIRISWVERLQALLVSLYLLTVLIRLAWRRKIPTKSLGLLLMSFLRRRIQQDLSGMEPETGNCYVVKVRGTAISDREGSSPLVLLENGTPLPFAHSGHEEIRHVGQGRYSHWGSQLYFATSDNSDPRHNGRRYRIVERRW